MKTTYTIVPAPTLARLEPFLKENNVEYSLLYGNDIPKDVPESCMWHGHEVHRHLVCVVSTMDPEMLLHMDEELHYGKTVQMYEEFYGKPYSEITQADLGQAEEINWGEDVGSEIYQAEVRTAKKLEE